jgi:hypothetical protein
LGGGEGVKQTFCSLYEVGGNMKRRFALFILCIVVVNACSPAPQVTVTLTPPPTETPIPTPTLHPQVIEIQETLAASGERFALMPNGTIQDGAETVPGLTVAPDGTMTLTVNGETVTLDPADVNFDDENGISIDGYELDENGEWVVAMSEAMQAAEQHFADLGYPTDGVEFVEGEVTVTGRVDGVKVFEMNIKSGVVMFDQDYVIEKAGQQDLMPTDIEPREDVLNANGQYFIDDADKAFMYFGPLFKRVRDEFIKIYGFDPYVRGKTGSSEVMLDPDIKAWGKIMMLDYKDPNTARYLYYELGDSEVMGEGTIIIVPLMPEK